MLVLLFVLFQIWCPLYLPDFALCFPAVFGSAPKVFPKLLNFSQDAPTRHSNPARVRVHVCVRVLSCAGIEVDLHHAEKYSWVCSSRRLLQNKGRKLRHSITFAVYFYIKNSNASCLYRGFGLLKVYWCARFAVPPNSTHIYNKIK